MKYGFSLDNKRYEGRFQTRAEALRQAALVTTHKEVFTCEIVETVDASLNCYGVQGIQKHKVLVKEQL